MEKRTALAFILSLIILVAYHAWVTWQYGTPPSPIPEGEEEKVIEPAAKPQPKTERAKPVAVPQPQVSKEIRVETDNYVAVFTSQGARLKSFTLKHYRTSVDEKSPPFEMVSAAPKVPYPLGTRLNGPNPFNDEALNYTFREGNLKLTGDAKGSLVFQGQIPAGGTLTKEFTFTGSSYSVGLDLSVAGIEGATSPSLLLTSDGSNKGAERDAVFEGLLGLVSDHITRERVEQTEKGKELSGLISWAGFGYTYFLFALLPENGTEQKLSARWLNVSEPLEALPAKLEFPKGFKDRIEYDSGRKLLTFRGRMSEEEKTELLKLSPSKTYSQAIGTLFERSQAEAGIVMDVRNQPAAKGQEKSRYTLFIGPKDLDVLKTVERGLERSIDFGYFGFVSIPFLYVMRFSHGFTASYGIDIIFLTILLKLLLAPLTHKSFVSMKQMQKLGPQMERLKEKFKDDREKLNKEIMELYRRNKVNPLGGCLPMLLQFPVFIGLYNALLTPIELRHASFMWIKDLSRPDWESLGTTLFGWKVGIPVLTLLMGASMFVQQWMTPSAGDPNQRRMMLMMPLVFTVMFVTFPAGLTIYWLVNNVLSIGQQYLINRMDR